MGSLRVNSNDDGASVLPNAPQDDVMVIGDHAGDAAAHSRPSYMDPQDDIDDAMEGE